MPRWPRVEPLDSHHLELVSQVRPDDWINPQPSGRYNLVVLGGGTAGLVTAAGAAGLGARVALVESNLLGGDCLNVGCVPSKALLAAARAAAAVRSAGALGISGLESARVDFSACMERMRRLRAALSRHDSAQRFRDLGVDVYFGPARFVGPSAVDVLGTRLEFTRAVIATGTRPLVPPVPGLESVPYLTNETLFSLTELPPRLGILGAGPIGCEMAQAFGRLGSQVLLIDVADRVLPNEDRDASLAIQQALARDGIELALQTRLDKVAGSAEEIQLELSCQGTAQIRSVDRLLVAVGRQPNIESLELSAAGVDSHPQQGVLVNDHLRTTNPRIYAAGDVCSRYRFTHAADAMARVVVQNALFPLLHARFSRIVIPWCTYTSPELAHVGVWPAEIQSGRVRVNTLTQPLAGVDRAVLDGTADGFVRVHLRPGTDRILGATIVAPQAGELISHFATALQHGLGLRQLGSTVFPYPTLTESLRKLGDQYNRARLTPALKRLLETWLKWLR